MSSNETISSGDVLECIHNKSNESESDADNYESVVKYSLANNDLIIDNIFKWLEPSQVIKCSYVCHKWQHLAQLLCYKRKYFSHKLLYFGLLSTELQELRDKYLQNIFRNSLEGMIESLNCFISKNRFMEFKVIIVFSKLDYHHFYTFVTTKTIPNDTIIIHINCRNEIIGSQLKSQQPFHNIESKLDFDHLSGISALFISSGEPSIQINVYEDKEILDIQRTDSLKVILVFHVWRSLYGHFSRLKIDSEFVEHLENFINKCNKSIAFGGATVQRLVTSKKTSDHLFNNYLDYICCLTISGSNVRAFSFIIDFEDNIETQFESIASELNLNSDPRFETIGFVFDQNIKYSIIKLRKQFKGYITLIGCAGISHGRNSLSTFPNQSRNLFFKRGKCILVVIQLNKKFDNN